MKTTLKFILYIIALVIIGLAVWYWGFTGTKQIKTYSYQPISFGEIQKIISSTGTVEPEELVNVGSQINGMITQFGKDLTGNPVDYGSQVKAGEILAWIDDSLYTAEVKSAEASCEQAQAEIASAEAEIKQSEASSTLAELDYERAKKLRPQNVISQSDYDAARSAYLNADAAINVSKAKLLRAYAQLLSAKAALTKAQRNFGYCIIKSPVDGVIIDRRVNVGQTVVSSMSASSLFLIAKDLKKMQVWVSVNEADIGEIKPNQNVVFTVDAFPGRSFVGAVRKIRLNATMSQNVVTYVVEIDTDNSDGTLLPYLTANVKFITAGKKDVFFVPNAALRYSPEGIDAPETAAGNRLLWVVDESGKPRAIEVSVGLNNGSHTEVVAAGLNENIKVITQEQLTDSTALIDAGGTEASPFMPNMQRRTNKRTNSK